MYTENYLRFEFFFKFDNWAYLVKCVVTNDVRYGGICEKKSEKKLLGFNCYGRYNTHTRCINSNCG